jgi:hypothetical protein
MYVQVYSLVETVACGIFINHRDLQLPARGSQAGSLSLTFGSRIDPTSGGCTCSIVDVKTMNPSL